MQVQQKFSLTKLYLPFFKVFHFATDYAASSSKNAALSVALLFLYPVFKVHLKIQSVPSKLNNDERKGLTWKIREASGLTLSP